MMARKDSEPGKEVEIVEGNSNLSNQGDAITRRDDFKYWGDRFWDESYRDQPSAT